MEEKTLIGIRKLSFVGTNNETVSGVNLYYTYPAQGCDGVCADRIFVTDRKFSALSYVPEIGGTFSIMYNKYGKVADIVRA